MIYIGPRDTLRDCVYIRGLKRNIRTKYIYGDEEHIQEL